jgi:hypothetical protein
VVLIGALGFATVPPLQKQVLDQAAGARRTIQYLSEDVRLKAIRR